MPSQLLTKSKYLTGLQCPKYLWTQFREPEGIPEPNTATQYMFRQGHLVGDLAKQLFPNGIDIPTDSFMGNVRQTKQLLQQRNPIFEAGILAGNIYARVDVLNPAGEDQWDIVEVKASTSIKEIHIEDVSFQKYCCNKLGLKIRKCFLVHINNQYVKDGEIDPGQLFIQRDISDEVRGAIQGIEDRINSMSRIISSYERPEVTIGKHCNDPYGCPINECWDILPEGNVFDLYRGGSRSVDLFSRGILAIKDIPAGYKLTAAQKVQRTCEIKGLTHINNTKIADFLGTLRYPLYYLDFETIGPAIPMFNGTRPYQPIPFQFSLHVAKDESSSPVHFSFLADGTDDPRPALLVALEKVLGNTGSIIVYNQGFEEGILAECARAFPEYGGRVNRVRSRLVDLLKPFSKFHYYNPLQKGSASLKSVLPAVTGRNYDGLEINDGQDASIAFQAVTYGEVSREETNKVRAYLEKYCALDTEGMIWIVDKLREMSR
jgi:hypothetical protein